MMTALYPVNTSGVPACIATTLHSITVLMQATTKYISQKQLLVNHRHIN